VFVKNLENVQGDERDVILFSICYGPDETGRVSMNFGPLNLQGGERRLNVAVTRARRELIVFSTIMADQIDLSRTRARGVADLKTFLAYAQHGAQALPTESDTVPEEDSFDSPLEQEICEALRARGHEVHSQVGCSGYRIDLAVVDPERPGRYILGIECDGANYHSAKTARDRDKLRQSVLVGLGWKLVRIWSSDWWERRDSELERICGAIEDARFNASAPPPPPPPLPPRLPPSIQPYDEPTSGSVLAASFTATSRGIEPREGDSSALPRYQARCPRSRGTQEEFYEQGTLSAIKSELGAVVANEGPIRLELAASQVAAAWGFERTRAKSVERVDAVAQRAQTPRVVHGSRVFLWPPDVDPKSWRLFRISEPEDRDQREAVDLPPEEVANAAAHLLAQSGACPRADLLRALARLFGFKAVGSTVSRYLDEGIQHLLHHGRAVVDSNGRIEVRE
jgi:very-short-patch-repair endonuclease